MNETRMGMVRAGVGGEHPTLGRLEPGQVVPVPAGLWSDELFAPVTVAGAAAATPVVVEVEPERLDSTVLAMQQAQVSLGSCQDLVRQAETAQGQIVALQGRLDRFRGIGRRVRDLQAGIDREVAESRARLEAASRELASLVVEAEQEAQGLLPAPAPEAAASAASAPAKIAVAPAVAEVGSATEVAPTAEEPAADAA